MSTYQHFFENKKLRFYNDVMHAVYFFSYFLKHRASCNDCDQKVGKKNP